jgi:ADP-ribosyl-[dinitrogen reductase] hydrolase
MRLTAIQKDRAAGALLATAAGDALGAGYEFSHPAPDATIEMIGGGMGFSPGEWTDDTSMAIGIAQVSAAGLDLRTSEGLDAVAAKWVAWYDSGPTDIGNQTRAVLFQRDSSAAAMTRTAAAVSGRKAGNGSLMRTAPVALAYLDDAESAVEAAAEVSALTHDDPRATQACRLWTYAIRHAVLYGNFDGAREFLRHADDDTRGFWTERLDEAQTGRPTDFPNNGWVVHALQVAWSAITNSADDGPLHLQRALVECVRAGHDTDTTAAIAGGLLGARWGASAVPARWRRLLHGYPGLRARDLVALAMTTVQGGDDTSGWPSIARLRYPGLATGKVTAHPQDSGVFLGDAAAAWSGRYDAVVSLCRMGSETLDAEHIEFWLVDQGRAANPNLGFVLRDAARTVQALRTEGKTVLVHCAQGRSRTPSVGAAYSMLLGRDPRNVLKAMPWAAPDPELWAAATASVPD